MKYICRTTPHAAALDQGIDSITIEAQLRPNRDNRSVHKSIISSVQTVEHLFRGLSNLNERLHHNVNQYLLPSSSKFVAHGEYIVPAVLLILPLALRAVKLVSLDLERFEFRSGFGSAVGASLIACTILYCRELTSCNDKMTIVAIVAYIVAYIVALHVVFFKSIWTRTARPDRKCEQQSIQLVACLFALYMHVPIALSHISLFIPSAIVWVPLLAFPDYGKTGKMKKVPGVLLLLAALAVIRAGVGIPWTLYVSVVFVPLHFLVVVLSLC